MGTQRNPTTTVVACKLADSWLKVTTRLSQHAKRNGIFSHDLCHTKIKWSGSISETFLEGSFGGQTYICKARGVGNRANLKDPFLAVSQKNKSE